MNYLQSGSAVVLSAAPSPQRLPGAEEILRLVAQGLAQPIVGGFREAAANLRDSLSGFGATRTAAPKPGARAKDCCFDQTDPCHCTCCITDADLVVYARLGERRVLPLVVENRWRRERQIVLELSGFTSRGGKPSPVSGRLLEPREFTLPPCGQRTVVLVVESGADGLSPNQDTPSRELPDVDDCVVSYADLRVTGCDIRPLRLAVALLPRDCNAYVVRCECECC